MKKIIYLTLILLVTNLANAVEPIVNAGWLNKNLDKVFILDIRNKIDGGSYETFKEGHIPGSVHSDYLKLDGELK